MGSVAMFSAGSISFIVFLVHFSVARDCGTFSVGECNRLEGGIVDVGTLPCGGINTHQCARICQLLCLLTANCNFFSYIGVNHECYLIHEKSENEFLGTCDVVAGPESPTLEECVENTPEDVCDRFVPQECTYLGETVFEQKDTWSSSECQSLLKDYGYIFQATFFVYDESPKHICQLKDTDRRTCNSVAGPQEPDYLFCVNKKFK